ncbi:MAG: prepilin-type N-terminal cleavage/methylation domain-containing protein [Desulfobacterales bacterium]
MERITNSGFRNHSGNDRAGLTLLEVLVAVLIFAVAMTTIYGSFNAVMGDVSIIEKKRNLYEMGKTCMDRMISDFKSLHVVLPPMYEEPGFDDDPDPFRFVGENVFGPGDGFSKVGFTAAAHLPLSNDARKGIARIVYYVQQTEDGGFVLRRSDTLFPFGPEEENPHDPVLCEHMRSFELRFYDEAGEAYESWDSDSGEFEYSTPRGIGIHFTLGDESGEAAFSTRVNLPVFREKKGS